MSSQKPRLLDLFCGAGGAAVGYARAGFEVVGVDHVAQPNYPFEFVHDDALDYVDFVGVGDFDAVHASPPCQIHTSLSRRWRKGEGTRADAHVDLIAATRSRLIQTNLPWVIENVEGARPKMGGRLVRICGSTVGLRQSRHRLFECGDWIALVPPCGCRGRGFKSILGDKPDGRWLRRDQDGEKRNYVVSSIEEGGALMGIDWMDWRELCEAIPPAYTELLGSQLIRHLAVAA